MRRKRLAIDTIAKYCFKNEKLYSETEYARLKDQPVVGSDIKKLFGTYARMLHALQSHDLYPEIQAMKTKPAPVVKKPTTAKTTVKKPVTFKPTVAKPVVMEEDDSE